MFCKCHLQIKHEAAKVAVLSTNVLFESRDHAKIKIYSVVRRQKLW